MRIQIAFARIFQVEVSKSMPLAGGSEVRRSIVGASLVSSNDSPFGPFVVGGVEAFGSVLRSSAARPAAAEAAVSPSGEASVGAEAPPNVAALSFAGRFDVAPPGVCVFRRAVLRYSCFLAA